MVLVCAALSDTDCGGTESAMIPKAAASLGIKPDVLRKELKEKITAQQELAALKISASIEISGKGKQFTATKEQLEAWSELNSCGDDAIAKGKIRGLLRTVPDGRLWVVIGSISSGDEGALGADLDRVILATDWKGKLPRAKSQGSYRGARVTWHGHKLIFTGEKLEFTRTKLHSSAKSSARKKAA